METTSYTRECSSDAAPIIIYGAGACGRLVLQALRLAGLEATLFCDKSRAGSEFEGLPVISPEALSQHRDAHVLIASSNYYLEMVGFLKRIQHPEYYDALKLISNPELLAGLSMEAQFDVHNLVSTYDYEVRFKGKSRRTNLFTLDVVVTERCSLRCKDCANAMQYYEQPKDGAMQQIEASLDRYLECVDYLPRAFFIGGEPFMNKELYKLINRFGGHPKIGAIWIFTNGSILPDRHHLDAMKRHKVMVRLSDYGPLVKNLGAFVETMEREGIPFQRQSCEVWQDLGPMTDRHYTPQQLLDTYKFCGCRDLYTLLHGKLYHCPWSAHGDNLGLIQPHPEDCIDLLAEGLSEDAIAAQISYLKNDCLSLAACGFCNGRGASAPLIPAAIQQPRRTK